MTRILICSPIPLYCQGLQRLLAHQPGFELVGTASQMEDWTVSASRLQPDLVLVDLALPESYEAVSRLAELAPTAGIVAMFVQENERAVIRCARAGVTTFVSREATVADLVGAITRAARGESFGPGWLMPMLLRCVATNRDNGDIVDVPERLTRREREVAALLELPNKEIARRLSIGLPTVKNHVHSILEKLEVHTRREAIAALGGQRDPLGA